MEAAHGYLAVMIRDHAELVRLIRTTTNAKQRDRYRAIQLAIDGLRTADIQPRKQAGRPTVLPPEQHEAFRRRVLDGPTEDDGVCTLRGIDILVILEQEFGVSYSLSGLYELLARLPSMQSLHRAGTPSPPPARKALGQRVGSRTRNK